MAQNNNEIEKRLWDAADELRANSKLKASEYSVPVLGLIFLLSADHKFSQAEKELEGKGTGRKKVGRELLEILKREKLVLDWRKRQQSRAQGRVTILLSAWVLHINITFLVVFQSPLRLGWQSTLLEGGQLRKVHSKHG